MKAFLSEQPEAEPSTRPRSTFLLLIENSDARNEISSGLISSGVRAVSVASHTEAISMAEHFLFHLFLIDGCHANGARPTLCCRLRDLAPQTPLVLYSPSATEEEIRAGHELGAVSYFVNPLPENLAQTFEQFIQSSKQSQIH